MSDYVERALGEGLIDDSSDQVRCVWITERQASRCPVDVMRAWDAAPADAAEAVRDEMMSILDADIDAAEATPYVLRALGMPDE